MDDNYQSLKFVTLVWGIILITTPACVNFAGVATNRFLLGTFEAVVNPGFILIMGKITDTPSRPGTH
jgi:hypothetical protein